ncbi:MAG: type II secretion system protein GspG, partial [Planctomycetota bacterium]
GGVEKLAARARAACENTFRDARASAAKEFDWSKAEFAGLVEDRNEIVSLNGIKSADIHFRVKAGDTEAVFRVAQCFKGPRGWVTTGGIAFRPGPYGLANRLAVARTMQDLRRVAQAIGLYRSLHKEIPATLGALLTVEEHSGEPLLDAVPKDAWGRAVILRRKGDDGYEIVSLGIDGIEGTKDDLVWRRQGNEGNPFGRGGHGMGGPGTPGPAPKAPAGAAPPPEKKAPSAPDEPGSTTKEAPPEPPADK